MVSPSLCTCLGFFPNKKSVRTEGIVFCHFSVLSSKQRTWTGSSLPFGRLKERLLAVSSTGHLTPRQAVWVLSNKQVN